MPLLFLLAALSLQAADPAAWVPARWPSSDLATLDLLKDTPINCLLVPEAEWSAAFVKQAKARSIAMLALIAPGAATLSRATRATAEGFDGAVLEGNFPPAEVQSIRKELSRANKVVIELGLRGAIPLSADAPQIIGTFQGIWAGIDPHEEGAAKAAPSGAPWIDTNAGFLRFVRAATDRVVWLSASPPAKTVVTLPRYLQMISDAAMVGARWIVTFDREYFQRLLTAEPRARKDFQRITQLLAFFEEHRALQSLPAYGQLAVVTDVANGALLSGSVLDMISVKHTPVRPVPLKNIAPRAFEKTQMAVNVDPQSLNAPRQAVLKAFAQAGGTVLTAPSGWRMPAPRPGQLKTAAEDIEKLNDIWKEVNSMTGRKNLGARLFNVSSMLSNMIGPADGGKVVLYLVNYSDFPVDSITVHLLGKYSKATMYWPDRKPKSLTPYENEDGSGVDIEILDSSAILIAEK